MSPERRRRSGAPSTQVEIGHLSKGRWEKAPPHIAVVALDPALPRHRRGTLPILVDLVGGGDRSDFVARALVETIQRSYAQALGGVREGLREGLRAADRLLRQENRDRGSAPLLAGVSCGILRGYDLFLAQGGPAFAAHSSFGRRGRPDRGSGKGRRELRRVRYYPNDVAWRGEPAHEVRPLGAGEEPAISLDHLTLEEDDIVVLTNAALPNLLEREEFEAAVQGEKPEEIRKTMGKLAAGGGSVLIMQVSSSAPVEEAGVEMPEEPSGTEETAEGAALEPSTAIGVLSRLADRVESTGIALGRWLRILVGQMLPESQRAAATPKVRRSLRQRERRRRRRRFVLALGIGAIGLIGVGAAFWWSARIQEGRTRSLLDEAERIVAAAEAADDGTEVPTLLARALGILEELEERNAAQPAIAELKERIWERQDRVARVARLASLRIALALTGSPEGHARVLYDGGYLYLLDGGAGLVYRYLWRPESESLQTPPEGAVLLRGEEVGGIEDILWMPPGEAWGDAALVVVGRLGLLEHTPGAEVGPIAVAEPIWEPPVVAAGFEGSLYLLEQERGRILRYLPTGRAYNLAPTDYLGADSRIELADSVDIAIESAVFVLRGDGAVLKFRGGEIEPFPQSGLSVPLSRPTGIHAVDGRVYVADPEAGRIVVFTETGEHVGDLRAPREAEEAFAALRDLFVDPESGLLFLISGQRLYTASLPAAP